MDRRSLIAGAAASFGAGFAAPFSASGAHPRAVVVGAGIVGVCAAYHLAASGATVTLIDRAVPGSGATQGAFAMLIATHEGGREINAFYGDAVAEWSAVERRMAGAVAIQHGGTVTWAAPGPAADRLVAGLARARAFGSDVRAVDEAELRRLVPGIAPGAFAAGEFSPRQGTLDPSAAHAALIRAAIARGVRLRSPCEAAGLHRDGGRLVAVATRAGPIAADLAVLCPGVDAPRAAAFAGARLPLDVASGALAHTRPFRRVLARVLNGPTGSIKQDPDGVIVTGLDYAPRAVAAEPTRAYGEALIAAMAKVLPAAAAARLDHVSVAQAPIPVDGLPAVGFLGPARDVYMISTMSGVTLAPLLGRLAAAEILSGAPEPRFAAWRPSRFSSGESPARA